jgi:hypothetical protein
MLLVESDEMSATVRVTTKDMGLIEWAVLYTLRERPDLHPDIADGLDLLLAQMNKVNRLTSKYDRLHRA